MFLSFAGQSFAAEEPYKVLAPLPCIGGDCTKSSPTTTLTQYIPGVFNLAIGISAAFVLLNLVFGGFQYMSSDAFTKKEEGIKRIQNSIKGLFLVMAAWLILFTINPSLVDVNLSIDTVTTTTAGGGVLLGGELSAGTGKVLAGYTLTPAQVATDAAMRKDLKDNFNIDVNSGPCTTGNTSGCSNLVGMPASTYSGLQNLRQNCPTCTLTISGGTEGGHASHGPSLPPVDIRFDPSLDNLILKNQISAPQVIPGVGTVYTSKIGNRNATFLKESDHWHVVFQ